MKDQRTIVCPHVLAGAMPEMAIVDQAVLTVAACHDCAIAAEVSGDPDSFRSVCRHTHPNLLMWSLDKTIPVDGCYQLIDGTYIRQPDIPSPGVA